MKKQFILCIMAATLLANPGCQPVGSRQPVTVIDEQGLRARIREAVGQAALNIAEWEIGNLVTAGGADSAGGPGATRFSTLPDNISVVLKEEGIAAFPQVRLSLEAPPLLLVISRRERIVYYDRVLLKPGLPAAAISEIEGKVDALDLSSLVVALGGFGAAYPAIVSPNMPGKDIVKAAVEEWAHQYLAFKPLGFLYLVDSLGLRQDPDIIMMNETLAGIIAQEIGDKVYGRFYADNESRANGPVPREFDFDKEMTETRFNADRLLAAGSIGEAEQYMKERCMYFNQHGYAIRKLNQAYFAFHGIYGQDPGAASPVYREMLEMRHSCANLAIFIDKVSGMTKYDGLGKSVGGLPDQ